MLCTIKHTIFVNSLHNAIFVLPVLLTRKHNHSITFLIVLRGCTEYLHLLTYIHLHLHMYYSLLIYRYLKHFAKYVDAYHILNSNHITPELFEKAERLLNMFVFEFEDLYGGKNLVINVHMTKHISKCVLKNGPLCCYIMEDNIGYLVSLIHGTTDIIKQCTQKYLLAKNLKSMLSTSTTAQIFYKKMEDERRNNKLLKNTNLNRYEIDFIQNTIQSPLYEEFSGVWMGNNFYRIEESVNTAENRKTYDSFIATKDGRVGTIKSIFNTISDQYILFREDYFIKRGDICESIQFLELNTTPMYQVAKREDAIKAVFIKFDNTLAFSTFPNNIERD